MDEHTEPRSVNIELGECPARDGVVIEVEDRKPNVRDADHRVSELPCDAGCGLQRLLDPRADAQDLGLRRPGPDDASDGTPRHVQADTEALDHARCAGVGPKCAQEEMFAADVIVSQGSRLVGGIGHHLVEGRMRTREPDLGFERPFRGGRAEAHTCTSASRAHFDRISENGAKCAGDSDHQDVGIGEHRASEDTIPEPQHPGGDHRQQEADADRPGWPPVIHGREHTAPRSPPCRPCYPAAR